MKGMRKIRRGRGFRGLLQYLLEEGKAQIIGGNMSGQSLDDLQREFGVARRLRSSIEKPVWHNSLRLPAGEKIDPVRWAEIADAYMQRMGFTDLHQRVVFLEDHPDGQHIHIVASRIALDGTLYLGQNENLKSTAIIEELEKDFGLTLTKGRDPLKPAARADIAKPSANELQKSEREGIEPTRERLQKIVTEALADRPTLSGFFDRIEAAGAHVIAAVQSTGRVTGLSFGIGEITFKASDLGRKFSFATLQKSIDYDAERDAPIMLQHSSKRDIPPPKPTPAPTQAPTPEPAPPVLRSNDGRQPTMQEIAEELGFVHDRRDKSKYHLGSDPYALDFDKGLWRDLVSNKGGKGGVSLIQHCLNMARGQAMSWLREKFGSRNVSAASEHIDNALDGIKLPWSKREPFQAPEQSKWAWGDVKGYLLGRGLHPVIIDYLHDEKKVLYAETAGIAAGMQDDRYQYLTAKKQGTVFDNAVFLATAPGGKVTGAEVRGTGTQPYKGAAIGTDKGAGAFSVGETEKPQEIVVVEAAIDAISYFQLHHKSPGLLVLSTAGGGHDGVLKWIDAHPAASITLAHDNDSAGNSMAAALALDLDEKGRTHGRHAPSRKDWNAELTEGPATPVRELPSVCAGINAFTEPEPEPELENDDDLNF